MGERQMKICREINEKQRASIHAYTPTRIHRQNAKIRKDAHISIDVYSCTHTQTPTPKHPHKNTRTLSLSRTHTYIQTHMQTDT